MEKELFIKQLRPYLYLMDEDHEATGYIVLGDERACVIDTMNGYNDLNKVVREITDKPVVVLNTHGHLDHIFGNMYFDEAYLNSRDWEMVRSFIEDPEALDFCRERGHVMPPFKPLSDGDIIDLGGRSLEVFELPGHTPGGVVLLLREDRILFSGDSINHHLWMQLEGCSTMAELVEALDRVMFLEERADLILHGHARDFDDISLLRCMRNGAKEICDGLTADDKPYKWFGGIGWQHTFKLEEGKKYSQTDQSVICYNRQN